MPELRPASDDMPLRQLGSYRLVRQLGSGGMSNVFEAIHQDTGSRVAVKVLPRKLAQNAVLLQRFLREAKSAETLDHPNIVAIYDRGFDQGRHYLVLEYVGGSDLADRVRADGPLSPDEALSFARQVATGLQYAAGRGMIHRDIKPANLLMTPDGSAKIIDLGLALQAAEEDERVTRDGTTVGTVDYMSPEQARDSRKISERSDIYSLGCTLYYLATGSPPFPGGTLSDKLARHHAAPPPDARAIVPTIPAPFVELLQKMMAKKPEARHQNYQELIESIDRIAAPQLMPPAPDGDLIGDDGDAVELTLAVPSTEVPPRQPAGPTRPTGTIAPGSEYSGEPMFSLAELAALEPDRPLHEGRSKQLAGGSRGSEFPVEISDLLEGDDEEAIEGQSYGPGRGELPLQTWIAAGIVVGLVLAVLAFGVALLFSKGRSEPESLPTIATQPLREEPAQPTEVAGSSSNPVADPDFSSRPTSSPGVGLMPSRPTAEAPVGGTPADPPSIPSRVAEVYPDALVSRLGMKRPEVARRGGGSQVTVRRLPDADDPTSVVTLAAALGRPNDDVEVADAGPIHEDDFTVAGRSRVIRARAGSRPIVKIEFARQQTVRDQPAKFLLGGAGVERLTIEGLDLVVDVRDLPLSQSTLFLCEGVELTIRDCTITVEHAEDRRNGYSLFRLAESSRPNRVLIERSLIRGPIQSLAEVEGIRSELFLDRSVVLGANLPMILVKSAGSAGEVLRFSQSVLVGRGAIIRIANRSTRLAVRSLGSVFARAEGGAAEPWIVGLGGGDENQSGRLDYDGEANRWFGWSGWPASKPGEPLPRLLDEIHRTSPDADRTSIERPQAWSSTLLDGKMTAAGCGVEIPEWQPILDQVAVPRPFLHELTVNLFPRPVVPDQADNPGGWAAQDTRRLVALTYDPVAPGNEDFGVYLAKAVTDPGTRYQVQLTSGGSYPMSPTRLPDGSTLAILGPPGQGVQQPVPTFYPTRAGVALIELHRGSLTLANLGLTNDGRSRTSCGVLVEDGLLVMSRFLYRDLSPSIAPGEFAVRFRAGADEMATPLIGGLTSPVTQPTLSAANCWIWTNGGGIEAAAGRGVLNLENCVLNSGKSAIELRPSSPSPNRLDASLLLENCTIIAERFAVSEASGGARAGGAGRPWVIISRSCVFPRPWRDTSTLLGVDPEGFAAGSPFWQSSNDVYDVGRFVAANRVALPPAGGADLKRHWVDLWGMDYTRGDRGPDARKLERLLVYRDKDRSRTSRPSIGQLELDPKTSKGQGADFSRLPPTPR